MRISEVKSVELVDLDGEPGFRLVLDPEGRRQPFGLNISTRVFGELLGEITFIGAASVRDYEYELTAAVTGGLERLRRERMRG